MIINSRNVPSLTLPVISKNEMENVRLSSLKLYEIQRVCGDTAILLSLNLRTRGGDPRSLPILNTLERVGLNSQTL